MQRKEANRFSHPRDQRNPRFLFPQICAASEDLQRLYYGIAASRASALAGRFTGLCRISPGVYAGVALLRDDIPISPVHGAWMGWL
jgi:hypothetical protein